MTYDPEAKARELIVRLNTEQPGITVRWLAAALAEAHESGRKAGIEEAKQACQDAIALSPWPSVRAWAADMLAVLMEKQDGR